MPDITYRKAVSEDAERLSCFTREVSGTNTPAAYWEWKFFNNPNQPSGIVLAIDGEQLVGLMAAFAIPMLVSGRSCIACQFGHNEVLPEYRPAGVYFGLAAAVVFELGIDREAAFAFGVAIDETRELSTVMLGFHEVGPVHKWVRLINPVPHAVKKLRLPIPRFVGAPMAYLNRLRVQRTIANRRIQIVTHLDERHDVAWTATPKSTIVIDRNAAFLEWRYLRCPLGYYEIVQCTSNGGVEGLAVTHVFVENGIRYGIVDDLVAYDGASETTAVMLNIAASRLIEKGVDSIVCWSAPAGPLNDALKADRFIERPAPRSWIVKPVDPAIPDDVLADEKNWYHTIGDSEYWMFPVESA